MEKYALISVSNKSNLDKLGEFLLDQDVKILSSGGTYKYLINELKNHQNIDKIMEISEYTDQPEMLDGRVKTLHPKIHGGILACRDNEEHIVELIKNETILIDIVIVNLYPFKETIKKENIDVKEAIENIDIGGHTLIRAAAKNFQDVLVITDPNDYESLINNYEWIDIKIRQKFAEKAYNHILLYDSYIANYFNNMNSSREMFPCDADKIVIRMYEKIKDLKYGCNPQQNKAAIYKNMEQKDFPFEILNGNPGYINIMDAIYSWNLVYELSDSIKMVSAASFKHTSPAGVGVSKLLSDKLKKVYNVDNYDLTPSAIAFLRARNADPMCSYGDFIAISHCVDDQTAKLIAVEVSDGIIAPEYSETALEILKKKKNGNYTILKAKEYINVADEIKELHGVVMIQNENKKITIYESLKNIVTNNKTLDEESKINLIIANTALKYCQSNSVSYAMDGQCVGIGAGQQSRIDCVKLARRKTETWYLRQHPKCINLMKNFKEGVKRQVKTNAIIKYIDGEYTEIEYNNWKKLFENIEEPLTEMEKKEFIKTVENYNVSLASDAFFPFRDNIDTAAKIGVKNIIQPGGSIADKDVINAANEYDMTMIMTGGDMRMFLH